MLPFKSFIAEGLSKEHNPDHKYIGHGDDPREFMENLIMPSHVYKPETVKESVQRVLEHALEAPVEFAAHANYLKQQKVTASQRSDPVPKPLSQKVSILPIPRRSIRKPSSIGTRSSVTMRRLRILVAPT